LIKEEKPAPKKQKMHDIRLHLNIAPHDLEIKLKHVESFLTKKEQVKITLQLLGREKSRPQSGVDFLVDIINRLADYGTAQKIPTASNLSTTLNPKK
jgi:translation initiation factor IF-3